MDRCIILISFFLFSLISELLNIDTLYGRRNHFFLFSTCVYPWFWLTDTWLPKEMAAH